MMKRIEETMGTFGRSNERNKLISFFSRKRYVMFLKRSYAGASHDRYNDNVRIIMWI